MQTRTLSLIESLTNVTVGYGLAVLVQIGLFPAFGIHVPISHDLAIAAVFTVVSVARSYFIRRIFNSVGSHP